MKQIMKVMLLVLTMQAISIGAWAQKNGEKQQKSREEFIEKQGQYIAGQLALDDQATKRFVETYMKQQKEVWALGKPHKQRGAEAATEAEAEAELKAQFEHSQKMLNIREKYYKEYSKFLTQKQIKRVFQIERKNMKKFSERKGQKQGMRGKRPNQQKQQKQQD